MIVFHTQRPLHCCSNAAAFIAGSREAQITAGDGYNPSRNKNNSGSNAAQNTTRNVLDSRRHLHLPVLLLVVLVLHHPTPPPHPVRTYPFRHVLLLIHLDTPTGPKQRTIPARLPVLLPSSPFLIRKTSQSTSINIVVVVGANSKTKTNNATNNATSQRRRKIFCHQRTNERKHERRRRHHHHTTHLENSAFLCTWVLYFVPPVFNCRYYHIILADVESQKSMNSRI